MSERRRRRGVVRFRASFGASLSLTYAHRHFLRRLTKVCGIFNFQLNVFSYLPGFNIEIFHHIWKPQACANAERTFASSGTPQVKFMTAMAVSLGHAS